MLFFNCNVFEEAVKLLHSATVSSSSREPLNKNALCSHPDFVKFSWEIYGMDSFYWIGGAVPL